MFNEFVKYFSPLIWLSCPTTRNFIRAHEHMRGSLLISVMVRAGSQAAEERAQNKKQKKNRR